jgi:hypothetical protein
MTRKYDYSIKWNQPYEPRKALIKETLNMLHSAQLDMIDEAVEKSDLRQAKEVIDYIRNKE